MGVQSASRRASTSVHFMHAASLHKSYALVCTVCLTGQDTFSLPTTSYLHHCTIHTHQLDPISMQLSFTGVLGLLSLQALTVFAQGEVCQSPNATSIADSIQPDEEVEAPSTSANLAVKISTSFPSSEIFGIKLVNGQPTQALLSISNDEPEPVNVVFIGGSLWTTVYAGQAPQIIRNLTTTRYNVEIPAGEKDSISYSFTTDLQPQDLKLNLATVITDKEGTAYTFQAFNETVSIVEPDTSIFDPQM